MKIVYAFLLGIIGGFSVLSCANGKKTQEQIPVAVKNPYYTTWTGGVKGAGSGLNLYIPVNFVGKNIELDSIYFRGKKAKLVAEPQNPDLYIAYFNLPGNQEKAPDLIMSSDPKEEYGNRLPVALKEFPFELEKDEAVIVFMQNGERSHFKINGIHQKEDKDEIRIKNPENIRH